MDTQALTRFVARQLKAAADGERAAQMAAYAKSTIPCYGVAQPARRPIFRAMLERFPPASRREYEAAIRALWTLPHREEKYAALEYARGARRFVGSASLPLYERLIRQGAWWDFVDVLAVHVVGPVLLAERDTVRPLVERWIDDADLWIRRSALIVHNTHKAQTDQRQLFDHCLRRAGETEFFIRKAIGWALRQYSYAAPEAVRDFLLAHREELSGLSFREGGRQLVRSGLMQA